MFLGMMLWIWEPVVSQWEWDLSLVLWFTHVIVLDSIMKASPPPSPRDNIYKNKASMFVKQIKHPTQSVRHVAPKLATSGPRQDALKNPAHGYMDHLSSTPADSLVGECVACNKNTNIICATTIQITVYVLVCG